MRKPGYPRARDGSGLRAGEPAAGLEAREVEQRQSGNRRHDRRRVTGLPEAALASDSGTVAERELQAATGKARGNRQARRRSAPVGHFTVGDRIAQQVVKARLEPELEPLFHADSYGYRPGKSALDAVGRARERCWRYDWVVDLDIKGFLDPCAQCPLIDEIAPVDHPLL